MTAITIDIETIHDEAKIELFDLFVKIPKEDSDKWWEYAKGNDKVWLAQYEGWRITQMSVTPEYCKMVGLNWMTDGEEPLSRWVSEKVGGDKYGLIIEKGLLAKAWQLMKIAAPIVTFNGASFDLEVIRFRSMVLGVEPTCDLINLKPWENRHIDMMKRIYVNRKPMGLKKLTGLLEGKLEVPEKYREIAGMEGSSVFAMYNEALETGDFSLLKLYGELDVIYNMELYKLGKSLWW